ncbi:kinesin-like protein KIN-10B [Salvia splendens]|uniref:kinesin-like protein KIN-10B n=1 Tax=Salvia splendens TaxID=180675 RepID=UPI001C27736B|nr:kinesin-like protein KIN-10B [Salvia splendens]
MATQPEKLCVTPTQRQTFSTPAKYRHQSISIAQVRVIVRLRPFLPHEISSRNGRPISCVSLQESEASSSNEVTVLLKDQETSRNECFNLDGFFGQDYNNVGQIFDREVRPLIPAIFQGYNATIFAYGATGSGKTYTMQGSDLLPGVMHLAVASILSDCKCTGSSVAVSYYEIYLDRCYDLLDPKEKEIMVLDDKDGQMHLKGLAQMEVDSTSKFHEIFNSALQRRKVVCTDLNDASSRSHGVLVITVSTPCHESTKKSVTGKLNLIDLAGNEDNRRICNEGIRLQESTKINQSLFALSNVIYALNNSKQRVPYRDSKLTRILQDSLGGTSHALMVACLNPGEYQECVHTVSLAARSRQVSNFVCPAHKKADSNMKVDMAAKLQAWLESKGKMKGGRKIFNSPFYSRSPCSVKPVRKFSTFTPSTKAVRNNELVLDSKERSSCKTGKKLFQGGVYTDYKREVENLSAAETNQDKLSVPVSVDASKSNPADEHVKETTTNKSVDASGQLQENEKIEALEKPYRKVLSPIHSNIERSHFVSSDPKTPTLRAVTCNRENSIHEYGTPLDKITSRSSSLKTSLLQDYIEFLNTASSEELMELKGIGQKMANYIIELRETSPLKSLGDLEKIGLSSKQVHNMFGRAARGLLENFIHNS